MSAAITAPELSAALAAQQARPVTPTNQQIDMQSVREWFVEQRAAHPAGPALTPKEMARWDAKSRLAWSGLQS